MSSSSDLGGRRCAARPRFAEASKAMEGKVRVEGASDIQEVQVSGDWAYVWTQLTIAMHPADGSAPTHRSGPGLSVWRKKADGRWVIFRDANMVTRSEVTAENAKTAEEPAEKTCCARCRSQRVARRPASPVDTRGSKSRGNASLRRIQGLCSRGFSIRAAAARRRATRSDSLCLGVSVVSLGRCARRRPSAGSPRPQRAPRFLLSRPAAR